MNTLTDTPVSARHEKGEIIVDMNSGETLKFPVTISTRLAVANAEQLNEITLSPFGLHWPQLDEDLSIRGILSFLHSQSSSGEAP